MTADFSAHPWRGRVLAELHARPFGVINTPARVLHYAFSTEAESAGTERDALAAFCHALFNTSEFCHVD